MALTFDIHITSLIAAFKLHLFDQTTALSCINIITITIYEAQHDKTKEVAHVPSADSDQTGQCPVCLQSSLCA